MKRLFSMFLAVCLLTALLPATVFAEAEAYDYSGKTVVLFTGNLRGNIDALPLVASARASFEARGADVILADTGNFLQGTRYSTFNSGSTMITLMLAAGYDVVALGKFDFAFGTGTLGTAFHGDAVEFGPLGELLAANPGLRAVSANISGANEYFHSFTPNTVITVPGGIDVAFFGITDIAVVDSVLESNLAGLQFLEPTAVAQAQDLELENYDFVIELSYSPLEGSVLVLVIDNETLEYTQQTISLADFEPDAQLAAAVAEFRAVVDAAFPQVGRSDVMLDGSVAANRSGETNLGNFWADALRWFAVSGEINAYFDEDDVEIGNDHIRVADEYVVALWNAGNLRDFLYPGDVTVQDLRRVLPFPNTVAVVYLTGAELLEQLEASAQGLPLSDDTFMLTASLMHVSGIEYTVDVSIPFNPGESFRDRIWYTAASVERVTITSINGRPFDENALYAVITSNANFNGMDISYVLTERAGDTENWSTITTARVADQAVMGYIMSLPNATIGAQHPAVAVQGGRIGLQRTEVIGVVTELVAPYALELDLIPPGAYTARGLFVNKMHIIAGTPDVNITNIFTDVPAGHRYEAAIAWAVERGIINGVTGTTFEPDRYLTRQELAVLLHRFHGAPAVAGTRPAFAAEWPLADAGSVADWASDAVFFMFDTDGVSRYFLQVIYEDGYSFFFPEALASDADVNAFLEYRIMISGW